MTRRGACAEMAALSADAQGLDFFMEAGTVGLKEGYRRKGERMGRQDSERKIVERKQYFPKVYLETQPPMLGIVWSIDLCLPYAVPRSLNTLLQQLNHTAAVCLPVVFDRKWIFFPCVVRRGCLTNFEILSY